MRAPPCTPLHPLELTPVGMRACALQLAGAPTLLAYPNPNPNPNPNPAACRSPYSPSAGRLRTTTART
eukprot:scaffold45292_cov48-Phaeocystis_antarctica.AAC.2